MFKKILFLALTAVILQARMVTDSEGKEVRIPDVVERATPMIGAFVQMSAMLGQQEKIISGASRLPPLMAKIFPKIRTSGNQSGMLGSSVETLIASKTQVVFGPVSMMFDENQIKQLNAAGIAVVRLDKFGTIGEIKSCVSKIAEILGGKSVQKAAEFNAYFDENVKYVQEKTANLKQKRSVLALNFNSGNFSTIGANDIGAEYIKVAGGINLSSDMDPASFKISKTINEEQVVLYDPDVIITNSPEGKAQIMKNASFQGIKAVKNAKVFVVPSGVYLWSVRSAEGALQPLWLGKMIYPELFAELNLEQKTKEFYEKFYGYELSDDEVKNILNPKSNF
ncbi:MULTISPECIES: ABC transporter substrate-binding protein [Campylobacter]|uniref:ABC transporter substrate-binding protein n=1 Tax=Campylobacter TaxID=194 RepID=UPI00027A3456|nr:MULTISPECIES: ABC transporter substrate-binding protein [Campylobacter]EJP75932.1 oligopeptide ABC transporter, oligopeptide-binding protein [Campylobacter sp. FOBRC14]